VDPAEHGAVFAVDFHRFDALSNLQKKKKKK